jgi:hypothetical protein
MAYQARETVLANPGRRVLILGSYRNREALDTAVREAAPLRVVSAEAWLEETN